MCIDQPTVVKQSRIPCKGGQGSWEPTNSRKLTFICFSLAYELVFHIPTSNHSCTLLQKFARGMEGSLQWPLADPRSARFLSFLHKHSTFPLSNHCNIPHSPISPQLWHNHRRRNSTGPSSKLASFTTSHTWVNKFNLDSGDSLGDWSFGGKIIFHDANSSHSFYGINKRK